MPDSTLPCPVRHHARTRPDAPALVGPDLCWTWAALDARVGACAARMAALGPPGTRVAVVARTRPEAAVAVLAALRSGAVLAPLSHRWPAAAVDAAVAALRPAVLLADDGRPGATSLQDWTAPGGASADPAAIPLGRPFTLVHTSGSSGAPKAALHTVGNHVWSARGLAERMPLGPADRWLLDLPLAHVGGLGVVVRCALAGAALAVPAPGTTAADALHALHPTHVSWVATQLRRLLADPRPLPPLRAVLLGGSALPPDLLAEARARGLPVWTSYGLTEMTSTVTAAPLGDRPGSGRILPHRDLRITATGGIEVRGRTLFAGYAEPGGLRLPVDDGWFATGDLGRHDGGALVVTGRADRRFVSGGENVQPEAIEAALVALDAVADAVVVPVADAEFGARPVAFVQTADGAAPDGAALGRALREVLPGFLVPAAWIPWQGADGMKADRQALARDAEARAAWVGL
jgi:O-succinylbenzoic acid--CoA ligase